MLYRGETFFSAQRLQVACEFVESEDASCGIEQSIGWANPMGSGNGAGSQQSSRRPGLVFLDHLFDLLNEVRCFAPLRQVDRLFLRLFLLVIFV